MLIPMTLGLALVPNDPVDVARDADSMVAEWLYSRMVAGHTPMLPAMGTMATLAATLLLAGRPVGKPAGRRRAT